MMMMMIMMMMMMVMLMMMMMSVMASVGKDDDGGGSDDDDGDVDDMVTTKLTPVYSLKQIVRGDLLTFSSNRSFLLRKRMMEVSVNHLLLQTFSNSLRLSSIRF